MHFSPQLLCLLSIRWRWFCCCWFIVLYTSHCLLGFCVWSLILVCITFSFLVMQLLWPGRELFALLSLSSWCLITVHVLWLLCTVPWAGLQYVIVVFPNFPHLFFQFGKILLYFKFKVLWNISGPFGQPCSIFLTDHSEAMLRLWIFFCHLCFVFVFVTLPLCSLQPYGHLL